MRCSYVKCKLELGKVGGLVGLSDVSLKVPGSWGSREGTFRIEVNDIPASKERNRQGRGACLCDVHGLVVVKLKDVEL